MARDLLELLGTRAVVLGPMAGITEAPFRGICKRTGAALTYTEMVSVKGLHFNPDSPISKSLLTLSAEETPCAVQIFGCEPQIMAEQARRLVERFGDDIALVDINMGCPVSKVVSRGEGGALMRTPELAAEVARRVVETCDVPVTVKMRIGWSHDQVNAIDFARAMEAAGVAALAVHGRTRSQFYSGHANWEMIAAVKEAVSVPVIGSGDVFSAQDVKAMFERTGVDAVMVARGAQGNPWIFEQARVLLDTGTEPPAPTAVERIEMAREHARLLVEFAGEHAIARMRKHVTWYMAEMPGATHVRARTNRVGTYAELDRLLCQYRDYLVAREARGV